MTSFSVRRHQGSVGSPSGPGIASLMKPTPDNQHADTSSLSHPIQGAALMAAEENVEPRVALWEVDDEIYRGRPPGSRLFPLTSGTERRTDQIRLRSDIAKRFHVLARLVSAWLDRHRERTDDARPRGRVW
jgi:hypothetical protein